MAERRQVITPSMVEVLDSISTDDARRTRVRLISGDLPPEPTAPAGLFQRSPWVLVLELHRLVATDDAELTFETYGPTDAPPAGTFVLQSWWLPDAVELVSDSSRTWTRSPYTQSDAYASPDFCLLTWESFEEGRPAYTDGRGAWVSESGYQRYIADDLLRLRARRD